MGVMVLKGCHIFGRGYFSDCPIVELGVLVGSNLGFCFAYGWADSVVAGWW